MNPPANWYPDPTGRHGQRYWDGEQWTEHVFSDGVQSVDLLEASESTTTDATTAEATVDAGEDDATSDGPNGAAELPRRQRKVTTAADQVDAPMDGAEGLFDDGPSGTTDSAETAAAAPAPEAWSPDSETDTGADADDSVAPEVEPEDVVANVDEVAESAEPDFSDAFVLAPETASRLVGRGEEAPLDGSSAVEDVDAAVAAVDGAQVRPDEAEAADAPGEDETVATPVAAAPEPAEAHVETPAVPLDAPPPTVPATTAAPTGAGGLGITGDLVGGAFAEREGGGDVALQNSRMLRCSASSGIVARQGTMVAYQGDVKFERQGAGGVGRALKRAATGEGLAMMRVNGNGDVFFADGGQHVFLLHLEGGPGLSVNGRNVLAFSASLQWDIERVKGASLLAGGLFNTSLTGTGWVALVADGEPVVLRTDEAPTYVDVNALVAWSGGLSTRIVNTVSAKSLVGLGSGEAFQMAFDGAGIVIVQPSEGPMGGAAAT